MDNGNDWDAFRLPVDSVPVRRRETNSPQPLARHQGAFIRGPIPLVWLDGVFKLPGRGPLVTALALMYQSGLERSQSVRVTHKLLERFGIPCRTSRDALGKLKAAGLVAVTKRPGRCREVTILCGSPGD